jgi:hypothetical protein
VYRIQGNYRRFSAGQKGNTETLFVTDLGYLSPQLTGQQDFQKRSHIKLLPDNKSFFKTGKQNAGITGSFKKRYSMDFLIRTCVFLGLGIVHIKSECKQPE